MAKKLTARQLGTTPPVFTDIEKYKEAIRALPEQVAGHNAGYLCLRLFRQYYKYQWLSKEKHSLNKYRTEGAGGPVKSMPYDRMTGSREEILAFIDKN